MVLMRFSARPVLATFLAVIALATITACGGDSDKSGTSDSGSERLHVEASFYPLQWMAERVGGAQLDVGSLTPPGAEPHDLELTPSDVASVAGADVVVYLADFQPAVDDAVADVDADKRFDAAEFADLSLTYTPIEEGEKETEEAGAVDPHFWLDPTRLGAVATAFADYLSGIDPANAETYEANAATLQAELGELDDELEEGLATCKNKDLVTSHNAFGYLADRYGLEQVGITGLTPEDEPSPADLAAVSDFVREHDVRTIYFETLVSPDIAEAIAGETGATTDVLDPIEGLNDESQGDNYLEIMRSNLTNLRAGQPCP
jgi:zinc transport system substrate-binding protein